MADSLPIQEVIRRRHELLRKLDKFYDSETDKENDLLELSSVNQRIEDEKLKTMKKSLSGIKKITIEKKIKEMRDIRKIMNEKYDRVTELSREVREFSDELVRKKEAGRKLREHLKGGKPTDDIPKKMHKLVEEILRW